MSKVFQPSSLKVTIDPLPANLQIHEVETGSPEDPFALLMLQVDQIHEAVFDGPLTTIPTTTSTIN